LILLIIFIFSGKRLILLCFRLGFSTLLIFEERLWKRMNRLS